MFYDLDDPWKRTKGLAVRLFGPMEVWLNGVPITKSFSTSAYALPLLALLVLNQGAPELRRSLADKLWNDDPEEDPDLRRDRLRGHLRKLRTILGSEVERLKESSVMNADALAFDLSNVTVDINLFHEALQQSASDPRCRRLEEAVRLYRGDLLTNMTADWVIKPRLQLRQEYVVTLMRLAKEAAADGASERAEEWLERALQADPLNEAAVRQLLELLSRFGETRRMEQAYDNLLRALNEHFPGRQPDLSTRKLFDSTRANARRSWTIGPTVTRDTSSPFHLPAPVRALIGQEGFCDQLLPLLRASRVITLIGPGGIGKTRIALEIAHRVYSVFPDGVAFIDLSSLPRMAGSHRVAQAIARVLNIPVTQDQNPVETLQIGLIRKEILLVLDNCEHVLPAVRETLNALAPVCHRLHILATSREPTRANGELPRQVPPLSFPATTERCTPEVLERSEAGRFFLQRVSRYPFAVTPAVAQDIGWICRVLEGMPLALEIAASALDGFETTRALVDSMRESLWSPDPVREGDPPHARTMEATIRWSYELLAPEESVFLQNIATLASGGELRVMEAVSGRDDALIFLRNLEARSLLLCDAPPNLLTDVTMHRFRLPEPVRQFAADRLTESGDADAAFLRHALWFADRIEELEPRLRGPGQTEALHWLEGERNNLDTALSWALRDEAAPTEVAVGLRLLGRMWRLWVIRGGESAAHAWMTRAYDLRAQAPPEGRLRLLQGAGNLALLQNDLGHAASCFSEAGALAREIGDQMAEAASLGGLASVARLSRDFETAKKLLEECREIFRAAGDEAQEARALGNLANVASDESKYANTVGYSDAAGYYEAAAKLFRKYGDIHNEILSCLNLTNTHLKGNNLPGAAAALKAVLPYCLETDNRRGMAHGFSLAITLLLAQKRYPESAVVMGHLENLRYRAELPLAKDRAEEYRVERDIVQDALNEETFAERYQQGENLSDREAVEYLLHELT